jgi:hypothetical protein
MKIKSLALLVAIIILPLFTPGTQALTISEFSRICDQVGGQCAKHPALNAYVGGGMDLIASLSEKTQYLPKKIYCKPPEELFNSKAIIKFMMQNRDKYLDDNAMLVFIKYFEQQGECDDE